MTLKYGDNVKRMWINNFKTRWFYDGSTHKWHLNA